MDRCVDQLIGAEFGTVEVMLCWLFELLKRLKTRNLLFAPKYYVAQTNITHYYHNMLIDTTKDISFEQFEQFIKTFYLQSLKELREMNEEDGEYDSSDSDDREGVMLNTEENVMTNVNMTIEDIDKSEIDKILK